MGQNKQNYIIQWDKVSRKLIKQCCTGYLCGFFFLFVCISVVFLLLFDCFVFVCLFVSRSMDTLSVRSQEIPQSHTALQTSYKIFIGKEKPRRVTVYGRTSREISRRHHLYGVAWETELSNVEISKVGIDGFLRHKLGLFTL